MLITSLRVPLHNFHRWFSSSWTPPSSSSLPWILPTQYLNRNSPKPDPPPRPTAVDLQETDKKKKYITHEEAINLIKRQKDPQHALDIFNKLAEQKGFNHNNDTYGTILYKFSKWRKFNAVEGILRQMKYEPCKFQEGIILNLMKHYSKCSLHDEIIDLFNLIQPIVREKPSLRAISTCLNLLVESDQMDLARRFLLAAKRNLDLKPNTCIFNILVKYHCRKGNLEMAFEVLEEMKTSNKSYPNLITYTTLMGGLCDSGRLEEAFNLFEEMVSKNKILPDAMTYNILINGFCKAGKVDRAKKIVQFMKETGCKPNLHNLSSLMNGFCKEGRTEEAMEVFDGIKKSNLKPDTITYTTLINCFCRAGNIDEARNLLIEMKTEGCKADAVTFNVVIGGLFREKKFDEAVAMLERLPYEGVYLNKTNYRMTLNALCDSGETEKAAKLLKLMLRRGFVPHFITSNKVLVQMCEGGRAGEAAAALFLMMDMGFKPEPNSWLVLLETVCRDRKLLPAFELLDELTMGETHESHGSPVYLCRSFSINY